MQKSVLVWSRPPEAVVQAFESRRQGRGSISALVMWAVWAVEGLHYLDDLDKIHTSNLHLGTSPNPDIIDIAHVRWATSTAVTALDLCAAALGREYCNWTNQKELDLRNFDKTGNNKKNPHRYGMLSTAARSWVDAVLSDARYKEIEGARHSFTHSRLNRNLTLGGTRTRTEFVVSATGNTLAARDLVILAKELARDQVRAFLNVIDGI